MFFKLLLEGKKKYTNCWTFLSQFIISPVNAATQLRNRRRFRSVTWIGFTIDLAFHNSGGRHAAASAEAGGSYCHTGVRKPLGLLQAHADAWRSQPAIGKDSNRDGENFYYYYYYYFFLHLINSSAVNTHKAEMSSVIK